MKPKTRKNRFWKNEDKQKKPHPMVPYEDWYNTALILSSSDTFSVARLVICVCAQTYVGRRRRRGGGQMCTSLSDRRVRLPWRKGARLEKNYGRPSVRIKQRNSVRLIPLTTHDVLKALSACSETKSIMEKGGEKKPQGVFFDGCAVSATFQSRHRM